MYEEIGSNFWLNRYAYLSDKEISLDFLVGVKARDIVFLSTGRSAIRYVLEHISRPKTGKPVALLPGFTCHTVIEPFLQMGYEVYFYGVDKHLECDIAKLKRDVQSCKPNVILFHGYFGFNTLKGLRQPVEDFRNDGVVIIEDVTQTLYSDFNHLHADFYIASLRKWGPLPDGGFAASTRRNFKLKPKIVDTKVQEAKLRALHAKYLYMMENEGDKTEFLKLFEIAEETLTRQQGYYTIGDYSRNVQANLDLRLLSEQRRTNFNILSKAVKDIMVFRPLFLTLPVEVTPLYFPVYVVGICRRIAQSFLAKYNIYCPVIWPKPPHYPSGTNKTVDWIYDHILAIPCDQRYGVNDMERIGLVLTELENTI